MIRINKAGSGPQSLTAHANTPGADFDSLQKDDTRKALVDEQNGLCAYCMKEIHYNKGLKKGFAKIEHWVGQKKEPKLQLIYSNLLAVCEGKNETCDVAKGNLELNTNPSKTTFDSLEKTIKYTGSGQIKSSIDTLNSDFEKLNLNEKTLQLLRKVIIEKYEKAFKEQKIKHIERKLEECVNPAYKWPAFVGVYRYMLRKLPKK